MFFAPGFGLLISCDLFLKRKAVREEGQGQLAKTLLRPGLLLDQPDLDFLFFAFPKYRER